VAYDKLADLSAPFRAAHWELMAKRLEEEFSLRHKLYKYKVAEIGLMLLLLLTIARYLPYAADLYQQKQEEQEQQEFKAATSPAVQMERPTAEAANPQALLQDSKQGNEAVSSPKTAVSKHKNSNSSTFADLGEKEIPANSISEPGRTVAKFEKPVTEIHSRPLVEIASQLPAKPFAEKLEGNGVSDAAAPAITTSVMGKADFLDLLDAQLVDTKTSKDFPILKAIPFEKQKQVRFSLFASTDLNYVFTPTTNLDVFDTLVRVDNDTAFALGYGGGILASFKMNRWEVQTGGVYSFRRYAPNTPKFTIETVGYYISEDFRGIQQDMLQVPLNMQYHFKNSGNWRFYGLAGASGYFITNVVYEIAFKREPTFALMAPPSNETRTLRDEKEFPKGLFDGGSLSDNFYLTANLGLGVERYISPRWSLFFQPNYHHYLMSEGVGTNKDKFYTLSFYLGTKVSLK
jgi:hypothetical protein